MKGVLLAGGSGTRLQPLTRVTNKHLLPVYDRPMIYYPLATLRDMGCEQVMVVLGGRSVGEIIELLHDGSDVGLDLTYRYQAAPRGIAHAIGHARGFAGGDLIAVALGDNILRASLRPFAEEFTRSSAEAGAVLKAVEAPGQFGVAELDPRGGVVRFEEKPVNPKSDRVPIGIYLFRPVLFEILDDLNPSPRGELEITDVLNRFIERGTLITHEHTGDWMDAGTVESLFAAADVEHRRATGSHPS